MAKQIQLRADDNQRMWNFIFAALYVLIFAIFVLYLKQSVFLTNSFGILEVSVIALAAFRLTRLFVYDEIMFFFRSWFMDREVAETDEGEKKLVTFREPENGPRKTLCHLLGCPWCTGVWMALFATIIYFVFSWGWLFLSILAVAGVATLLQLFANLLGWKAEGAKRSMQDGNQHS